MDQTRATPCPGPVTPTVIITVSNKATLSSAGEDGRVTSAGFAEGDGEECQTDTAAVTDGDDDSDAGGPVRGVGFTNLADLARRSLRARAVRRRLALHRLRRRYHQQQAKMCALAISRQVQLLRRDKEILTNFVRLRLYETQSSFSGSDVASSSGMDRSSDSERQDARQGEELGLPLEGEPVDDGRVPRQMLDPSAASGASTGASPVADDAARDMLSRKDEEVRKILRLRRRRRRHLLQSCEVTPSPTQVQGERVEQYTDTTRNAAVVMGEKDIKQSLRAQRRSLAAARGFSLPACAQPDSLTALARAHRRAGNPRAGLVLLEQALLLDPMSQRALLERSQCYQVLGQPRLALLDAEDALDLNRKSDAALYQKAQALYAMGHFEKALVVYHRCSRLRPENPEFKSGIRRATEAIMNTIACLPKDFRLSSLDRLLSNWPDEEKESSVGSFRRPVPAPIVATDHTRPSASVDGDGESDCRGTALQVFGVPRPGSSSSHYESDDPSSVESISAASALAVCHSCNMVHHLGEDRLATTPPCGDVEEEARKIALILSLTSTFDHRNKHLRDKLRLHSRSASPKSASAAPSTTRTAATTATTATAASSLARPRRSGRRRQTSSSLGSQSRDALEACIGARTSPEPRVPKHWLVRASPRGGRPHGSGSIRPGMERVPPSLGRDVQFLEQIALDPDLRGLPVSGIAEEGVRYLKSRQVFWYRRGPINPDICSDGDTSATQKPRSLREEKTNETGLEKLKDVLP